jgi:hypothetical protein
MKQPEKLEPPKDVDIILGMINSNVPVIDGSWLEEGQYIIIGYSPPQNRDPGPVHSPGMLRGFMKALCPLGQGANF